ncbi:MAG: SulP family inorganic anion transporter [Pseudomonadota bacterium]
MRGNMAAKISKQVRLFKDLNAAVIVFLVALPLCLGIALASNAPLLSGILAGIVGGLVVAPLTGSPLSVSGPAAGLVVIVITAIETLGSYEAFVLAVAIAGVFQVLLSQAKAGFLGSLFPSSVIKGMLAAIGVILILKQLPHIAGLDRDPEGDLNFWQVDGENTFSELLLIDEYLQIGSLIVGILALVILLAWDRYKKPNQNFPMALVVVVGGTLLGKLLGLFDPSMVIDSTHLVSIPDIDWGDLSLTFAFPDFDQLSNPAVYKSAAVIAIVASIETLLCIDAVDKLDPHKRLSDFNKELSAQGVGNIISGLIGGLPLTAVIVRGSANVAAGAETRLSSFVHGLLLLSSVLVLTPIMNEIPLSVLAAILIVVGLKLTQATIYFDMWSKGYDQFLPFVTTVLVIVFSDLLTGVAVGTLVAIIFILRQNLLMSVSLTQQDNNYLIRFRKDVSFVNKIHLKEILTQIPDDCYLMIDGKMAVFIDEDIKEMIREFQSTAEERGIEIELSHVRMRSTDF